MYVVHCRKGPAGAGRGEDGVMKAAYFYNCRKGPAGAGRRGEDGEMFMYSLKCCGDEMLLVDVMFIKDVCVIIT